MVDFKIESKLEEAAELDNGLNQLGKFKNKYNLIPAQEAERIHGRMRTLADSLPIIDSPQNTAELYTAELKRVLTSDASCLKHDLTDAPYTFDEVVDIYGIPRADLAGLRPWLEQNKVKTQEAVARLFNSGKVNEFELVPSFDIPSVRRQAEEVVGADIQRYHKNLGKFLEGITTVGHFLRDITAAPTTEARSYFNSLTNTLAIGIPSVCYSKEDGTLHMRQGEMIKLYGHEGMGHALNFVLTAESGLPDVFKKRREVTRSTAESVAQFYQRQLLEDLKRNPEIQRKLEIAHCFDRIYQEAQDTRQIEDYNGRIFQYAITVLADKSFGEPQDPKTIEKKVQEVASVAINNMGIRGYVEGCKHYFDSRGNLSPQVVGELVYCAQPVARAIKEFESKGIAYDETGKDKWKTGRSRIDRALLTGLWTPAGFVDNARLIAEGKGK